MVYFPTMPTRPLISGPKLRARRDSIPLSQAELAERADLNVATIKAIEASNAKAVFPRTVRALVEALDCAFVDLAPDRSEEVVAS